MSDQIRDTILSEAAVYLSMSVDDLKRRLSRFDSVATLLNSAYNYSVSDKEIEPIENLPEEEKKMFWSEAKGLRPDANQKKLIQVAKSLYLKSKL